MKIAKPEKKYPPQGGIKKPATGNQNVSGN